MSPEHKSTLAELQRYTEQMQSSLITSKATRTYLGGPTTFSSLSTSSKKSRSKRKLARQNRKKGRK